MKEEVILVDTNDAPVGLMEKMEAHRKGILHRAFSVFVFNSKKELLLQQRASHKYHSGNLWSNTCCSHPREGETTLNAAQRRLQEEMGLELDLDYKGHFIYKAALDNELTEHEYDHVYFGHTDKEPSINPEEVAAYRWQSAESIRLMLNEKPDEFTIWFKEAFDRFI